MNFLYTLFGLLLGLGSASSALGEEVHDITMPEVLLLQDVRTVLAPLPKAFDGRPDWVQGIKNQQIDPRETLWGAPRKPEPWGDAPKEGIVFMNTRYMPYVVFPHQPHTEWLACSNCHDALFARQRTGSLQGMTAIFQGKTCGVCHGSVAFPPEGSCYRCHSKPNPTAQLNNSPYVAPKEAEPAPPGLYEEESGGWFKPRRRPPQPAGLRPAPRVAD